MQFQADQLAIAMQQRDEEATARREEIAGLREELSRFREDQRLRRTQVDLQGQQLKQAILELKLERKLHAKTREKQLRVTMKGGERKKSPSTSARSGSTPPAPQPRAAQGTEKGVPLTETQYEELMDELPSFPGNPEGTQRRNSPAQGPQAASTARKPKQSHNKKTRAGHPSDPSDSSPDRNSRPRTPPRPKPRGRVEKDVYHRNDGGHANPGQQPGREQPRTETSGANSRTSGYGPPPRRFGRYPSVSYRESEPESDTEVVDPFVRFPNVRRSHVPALDYVPPRRKSSVVSSRHLRPRLDREMEVPRAQPLQAYDGKNWDLFEREAFAVATAHNWDEQVLSQQLILATRGKVNPASLTEFGELPFPSLLRRLRELLGHKTAQQLRADFKKLVQTPGESPRQFAERLQDLAETAYGGWGPQLNDIVVDEFGNRLLNPELRKYVRLGNPPNLTVAIALAEQWEAAADPPAEVMGLWGLMPAQGTPSQGQRPKLPSRSRGQRPRVAAIMGPPGEVEEDLTETDYVQEMSRMQIQDQEAEVAAYRSSWQRKDKSERPNSKGESREARNNRNAEQGVGATKAPVPAQQEAKAARKFPCNYCEKDDHKAWNCPLARRLIQEFQKKPGKASAVTTFENDGENTSPEEN